MHDRGSRVVQSSPRISDRASSCSDLDGSARSAGNRLGRNARDGNAADRNIDGTRLGEGAIGGRLPCPPVARFSDVALLPVTKFFPASDAPNPVRTGLP